MITSETTLPEPDQSARAQDGYITSAVYARQARRLRGQDAPAPGNDGSAPPKTHAGIDYHHPLEDYLGKWYARRFLGRVSRRRRGGKTVLEEIITSYAHPGAPLWQRIKYWPFHMLIKRIKGGVTDEAFRKRVAEHTSTVRGLVATARSVAEFGLTLPQRFSCPLIVVWNFTNRCNLRCRHCYQHSEHRKLPDELNLEEKLRVVDDLGESYVPMIALAGGEPTICPDLLPVLRRCQRYGIHTTVATHGGTMTPKLAARLAEAGVKYVEVSLDSVHSARHDAFRGQPGMWQRTVRGMQNVVKQEGLRLGLAMCVHQDNFHEVEDMLQFAVDIGASCFAHFNFIPVGRGVGMADADLDPRQREQLLRILNDWMQSGRIGVLSTGPQFGRVCLAYAPPEGRQACSHAGSGAGIKARVVAKYLGGCGAGRTYAAIQPNGDVTPCVYMPDRVMGNVRQGTVAGIFRNHELWDLLCDRDGYTHHCRVCEFKNYCGGCRARADAYFGRPNAGDPGCLFNASYWDDLVVGRAVADPAQARPASRQTIADSAQAACSD